VVEEVEVAGPPTSVHLRAAGWAEALLVCAAAGVDLPALGLTDDDVTVHQPDGGSATVSVDGDAVRVRVVAGDPLDEIVLRSYCIGAVHMALGWICSESVAVDEDGTPHDLTVRSLGVLRPAEVPRITVEHVEPDPGVEPLAVSSAVFVATAIAEWRRQGFPADLPTGRLGWTVGPPRVGS